MANQFNSTPENKKIYMYALDTLADWEWGYITAELRTRRFLKKTAPSFTVQTFGLTKEPITTMGGVRILPDLSIDEVTPEDCALLLLPGGETWLEPFQAPVMELAKRFLSQNIPVAAICGATMALGQAGVLDTYKHTSNDLSFLKKMCPNYHGEHNYIEDCAVTDGLLITAGGNAPLEAALHVFKKLTVFSDDTLEYWYKIHKEQKPEFFYKLVQSLA